MPQKVFARIPLKRTAAGAGAAAACQPRTLETYSNASATDVARQDKATSWKYAAAPCSCCLQSHHAVQPLKRSCFRCHQESVSAMFDVRGCSCSCCLLSHLTVQPLMRSSCRCRQESVSVVIRSRGCSCSCCLQVHLSTTFFTRGFSKAPKSFINTPPQSEQPTHAP